MCGSPWSCWTGCSWAPLSSSLPRLCALYEESERKQERLKGGKTGREGRRKSAGLACRSTSALMFSCMLQGNEQRADVSYLICIWLLVCVCVCSLKSHFALACAHSVRFYSYMYTQIPCGFQQSRRGFALEMATLAQRGFPCDNSLLLLYICRHSPLMRNRSQMNTKHPTKALLIHLALHGFPQKMVIKGWNSAFHPSLLCGSNLFNTEDDAKRYYSRQ